jgi:NAD(P) transhydrogenase subunit alpha
MNIGILKESAPESRVAATPELVQHWVSKGHTVWVEEGSGSEAAYADQDYVQSGASVGPRAAFPESTEVLVSVHCPTDLPINGLSWLIGTLSPSRHRERLTTWAEGGLGILSLDALPRITRAQNMDVLSSQASLGGYHAVVEAATLLPRCFPMMMTAAGTVVPARVLIIGAGVAGLQAVATAKRLGAVVVAFDTRPSVKEQVESLGGQFVEIEGAVEDRNAGGYAVVQSEEYRQRQQERLNEELCKADVVITTAQIPGQKAPILVNADVLKRMKAGSVVMDLAAGGGGNCEGTVDGQNLRIGQALVCGRSAPASAKAQDASRMYSKNLQAFTALLETDPPHRWDLGHDEIVAACCLAYGGEKRGNLA